jgi:hypothetical protein
MERQATNKKTGKQSCEIAYGITVKPQTNVIRKAF